jgi:hypothetical protein
MKAITIGPSLTHHLYTSMASTLPASRLYFARERYRKAYLYWARAKRQLSKDPASPEHNAYMNFTLQRLRITKPLFQAAIQAYYHPEHLLP